MSVVHKAVFLWASTLVFVILITVRVVNDKQLNWFLVFIPMWLMDIFLLSLNIARLVRYFRDARTYVLSELPPVKRVYWYITLLVLKVGFQGLLCTHLEFGGKIRLWNAMIPLWILLCGVATEWFWKILQIHRL